jgi:cell division protein ZipA
MPELRLTLLVLGVLFVAALAWWELRKPRQAQRGQTQRSPSQPGLPPLVEPERRTPGISPADLNIDPAARVFREPTLSLPDIRPRDPMPDLPVIEMSDDSMIGLRIDGKRVEEDVRAPEHVPEPPAVLPSEREPEPEPSRAVTWEDEREIVWDQNPGDTPAEEAQAIVHADPEEPLPAAAEVLEEPALEIAPAPRAELNIGAIEMPALAEPIVDWPEDSQRQIVALRLVAPVDRFPGRAVRQALSAEGFMLGKFAIYHKAGPDGRAVVSAASLTRPGTFDAESIDMQRFGGLNLFVVLPGPLPAAEAFDELLATARTLNERLQGGLQDEKGQPLTPTRVAAIRSALVEPTEPAS